MKIAHLIFAALPLTVAAEPITLKGLAPGMTKAQFTAEYPSLGSACMPPQRAGSADEICGYHTKYHSGAPALHTFAGAQVGAWMLMLKDGVVTTVMILFPSSSFDQVEAALVERWGKPAGRTVGEVKNRMGASFDQVEVRWLREGSILRGSKRSGKIDEASFSLTTERSIEEGTRARKDAAKDNAKDM